MTQYETKTLNQILQTTNLHESFKPATLSQSTTLKCNKEGEYSISVYQDPPATPEEIKTAIQKLQIAFPQQEKGFWALLGERIVRHNFTAKRLTDAVNNTIDNQVYPRLQIADIIGFNPTLKLYTYAEVLKKIDEGIPQSDFVITTIKDHKGRPFWAPTKEHQNQNG